MENEVWVEIDGYNKNYHVSNFGRVKSFRSGKERVINGCLNKNGYLSITMYDNCKMTQKVIHQLVAISFLKHKPHIDGKVIDHIDGNKTNNCISNLRVVDNRFNITVGFRKDFSKLSSTYAGVSWSKTAKKWRSQIMINKKQIYLGYFNCEIEAHKSYLNALKSLHASNQTTPNKEQ